MILLFFLNRGENYNTGNYYCKSKYVFIYNVGTINNTIIHECVHLERYKMFFELMRLLSHECHFISCQIVEIYGKDKTKSTPLDWIEWQANTIAPKILMPASTTKKFIQDRLYNLWQFMNTGS